MSSVAAVPRGHATCLRNLCLNRIQKNKRTPDHPGATEGMEIIQILPDRVEEPYRNVTRKELAEQIRKAMDQLPDDHREIIHLRHFEDLSYEEIAKIMDIPMGTVMSRLYNARKKMARLIQF